MKTSSHIRLMGPRGERGWGMLPHPHPRLPVGGENFPVYIPVGEEISPSPFPNRGIPRGESGIGSHCHLYSGGGRSGNKCLGEYVCMRRCSNRQMYETSKKKRNEDWGSRYIEIDATQHQCKKINFFFAIASSLK
jgi:hypothetical protein